VFNEIRRKLKTANNAAVAALTGALKASSRFERDFKSLTRLLK
jgi:hypothetical protein